MAFSFQAVTLTVAAKIGRVARPFELPVLNTNLDALSFAAFGEGRVLCGTGGPAFELPVLNTNLGAPSFARFCEGRVPCGPYYEILAEGLQTLAAISPVCLHICAQDGVDAGLISAFAAEPAEQVGVEAHSHDFFRHRQDNFG